MISTPGRPENQRRGVVDLWGVQELRQGACRICGGLLCCLTIAMSIQATALMSVTTGRKHIPSSVGAIL